MSVVSGTGTSRGGRQLQRDTIDAVDRDVLTLRDVSDRLGISHETANRFAKDGVLPAAVKLGSVWRVPAGPFEAWKRGWWTPTDDGPTFEDWYASLKDTTRDCD